MHYSSNEYDNILEHLHITFVDTTYTDNPLVFSVDTRLDAFQTDYEVRKIHCGMHSNTNWVYIIRYFLISSCSSRLQKRRKWQHVKTKAKIISYASSIVDISGKDSSNGDT